MRIRRGSLDMSSAIRTSVAKVIGILHKLDETVKGVDIGAFGAARRASKRPKHYPVGIVEAIDRLVDESARKSDVEWVLDVAGCRIVTPDHVGGAGCELLYFCLHRLTVSHAARLPIPPPKLLPNSCAAIVSTYPSFLIASLYLEGMPGLLLPPGAKRAGLPR